MNRMYVILAACIVSIVACERSPYKPDTDLDGDATASPKALLLNEGAWGNNNAELSLLDNRYGQLQVEWFSEANQRGLGDVAQDMVVYGSKAYVTVTFSNSLEVVDTATGKSQRIDLGERQPRYIATSDGNLYITCYRPHSVICIDTAGLQVKNECRLGDFNPEGIVMAGGRLYVASSFVQDENSDFLRDSVLYVIDPLSMTVTGKVVVGLNPQLVVAVDDNYLAVNYSGDYTPGSDGTAIVNTTTGEVAQLGLCFSGMCAYNDSLYGYVRQGYGSGSTAEYYRVDPATLSGAKIPITVGNPYGISVDPANGDIYVTTDGNYISDGDLMRYSPLGSLKWKITAARLPKKLLFMSQK